MIILGLTGSIGMGKSTTAQMFKDEGIPVYDADAEVHKLYDAGGAAVPILEKLFPGCVVNGKVDRQKLSSLVVHSPENMKKLEAAIHPLVGQVQKEFMATARRNKEHLVVLDIPLLLESNRIDIVDYVLVVTAPADVQKARVLEREGMTEEKFLAILSRQVPDKDKRKRADFIIETDKGLEHARNQVRNVIQQLVEKDTNAHKH